VRCEAVTRRYLRPSLPTSSRSPAWLELGEKAGNILRMRENVQVKRWIEKVLPSVDMRGLVLLTGARQTGKTTSTRRLYADLAYYNLDAMEYREQLSAVSSFAWAETVGKAVLDEVQKAPALLDKVKFAYDDGRLDFTALLGSAQILLLKNVKETLAGRVFLYELFPLMLSELVAGAQSELRPPLLARLLISDKPQDCMRAEPVVLLGEAVDRFKQAERHLWQWGGMPGLLPLSEQMRRQWLKSYEITYLERDLGDLARLDDLKPFRRFQKLAALRSGQILSFSELARDAGVAVETARRYLEYLRLSYQAFLLQPFSENITSQVVKTPKVFWMDCGLLRLLTGRVQDAPMDGHFFESYVASELLKLMRTLQTDAQLFYYRTRSGLEVDFLVQPPHGLLAIEVKGRDAVGRTDIASMKRLADKLGKRWLGGLVVYQGDRLEELESGCWAVPSYRLLG
jgi:predicted AAA+ superfamily ATPase